MHYEFFITDADYAVREGKPCVRIYGRTKEGKSIIVFDVAFYPYFYVVPRADISKGALENLKSKIESLRFKAGFGTVSDDGESDENMLGKAGAGASADVSAYVSANPAAPAPNPAFSQEISVKKAILAEKFIGTEKRHVLKVFANLPPHVPHLRKEIKYMAGAGEFIEAVCEYDILFYKRYLFDKRLMPAGLASASGKEISESERKSGWYAPYSADILVDAESLESSEALAKECDVEDVGLIAADIETIEHEKKLKVIMASAVSDKGYAKVISYEKNGTANEIHVGSEKELIAKLFEMLESPQADFIITYNGDAFDFFVLDSRAKDLKVKSLCGRDGAPLKFQKKGRIKAAVIKGRPHIDLYNFVERIMSPAMSSETLSLDSVALEILGEGKHSMTWDEMKEYWAKKQKLDKLAEYCIQDSALTLKLAMRILPNIFALSQITAQIPSDTSRMTYGQLVEHYAIKRACEMGVVVPNKPSSEEIKDRMELAQYAGGFVKEPKAGLYENIAVFDFRGLYPSIIVSHNIDPSTLNCECCAGKQENENRVPEKGYYFCTKNKGFIPSILEELVSERKKVKAQMKLLEKESHKRKDLDARQFALKTVSNAMYGYLGFAGSRWYKRECAEGVTAFGRHYIQNVIGMAQKEGFDVLYGDTDSLFLRIESQSEKGTGGGMDAAAKDFLEKVNATLPGIMALDLQGIYVRGIFVSKKIGEGGAKKRYALIDKNGNITIRGFEKVRRDWSRLSKDTQEKVLELVLNKKKDEAVSYVKKIVAEIKGEKADIKDLRIYSQLTRQIKHYALKGPHVAAAEKAIARGKQIRTGETLEFVVTKGKGSISERAELFEFAKNYDPEYYINNQIVPAALRVLHIFGVTEDDLLGKPKQKGLGSWGKK